MIKKRLHILSEKIIFALWDVELNRSFNSLEVCFLPEADFSLFSTIHFHLYYFIFAFSMPNSVCFIFQQFRGYVFIIYCEIIVHRRTCFCSVVNRIELLISQRFHRIAIGRSDRVERDRSKSYQESDKTCKGKIPYGQVDLIWKVLQPFFHKQICQRPGY